jgi:hypothetical protein
MRQLIVEGVQIQDPSDKIRPSVGSETATFISDGHAKDARLSHVYNALPVDWILSLRSLFQPGLGQQESRRISAF